MRERTEAPLPNTLRAVVQLLRSPGDYHGASSTRREALAQNLAAIAEVLDTVSVFDLRAAGDQYTRSAADYDRVADNYENDCDPDNDHDQRLLADVPGMREQARRRKQLGWVLAYLALIAGDDTAVSAPLAAAPPAPAGDDAREGA